MDRAGNTSQQDPLTDLVSEVRALRAELAELRAATTPAPYMSVSQVAQALGCKRTKVFQLLKAEKLTRAQAEGRNTYVTRESLEAYRAPKVTARRQTFDVSQELAQLKQAKGHRGGGA